MDILELVEKIQNLDDMKEAEPLSVIYRCLIVKPLVWDKSKIEEELNIKVPQELILLWSKASEIRLFEEKNYGQWGLILHNFKNAALLHNQKKAFYAQDFRKGDFVIGEFLGDAQFVVLRCDASGEDFGNVIVAQPIDSRKDWLHVANSLSEFLSRFIDSPVEYYWTKN